MIKELLRLMSKIFRKLMEELGILMHMRFIIGRLIKIV
jgi:hypothetical protein